MHKYGLLRITCLQYARDHYSHGRCALFSAVCGASKIIFGDEAFTYYSVLYIYLCPSCHILKPRRMHPFRRTIEFLAF